MEPREGHNEVMCLAFLPRCCRGSATWAKSNTPSVRGRGQHLDRRLTCEVPPGTT